jgi:hypothetical protein
VRRVVLEGGVLWATGSEVFSKGLFLVAVETKGAGVGTVFTMQDGTLVGRSDDDLTKGDSTSPFPDS